MNSSWSFRLTWTIHESWVSWAVPFHIREFFISSSWSFHFITAPHISQTINYRILRSFLDSLKYTIKRYASRTVRGFSQNQDMHSFIHSLTHLLVICVCIYSMRKDNISIHNIAYSTRPKTRFTNDIPPSRSTTRVHFPRWWKIHVLQAMEYRFHYLFSIVSIMPRQIFEQAVLPRGDDHIAGSNLISVVYVRPTWWLEVAGCTDGISVGFLNPTKNSRKKETNIQILRYYGALSDIRVFYTTSNTHALLSSLKYGQNLNYGQLNLIPINPLSYDL